MLRKPRVLIDFMGLGVRRRASRRAREHEMAETPALPPPPPRPSLWEAFQSFDLGDSLTTRFARVPCQRKALVFGITGGTAIGALRFITTKRGWPSINWGVYSFVFLSGVSYYDCSKKRQVEVEQIQQVVTKMNQLKPSNKLKENLVAAGEEAQQDKKPSSQSQTRQWWPW